MKKRQWLEVSSEPISEQAIRSLHNPEANYRISSSFYPQSANFAGTLSVSGFMYFLSGKCEYELNGEKVILQAPEFVEIEPGKYTFEVLCTDGVKVVNVYKLPPFLRKPA